VAQGSRVPPIDLVLEIHAGPGTAWRYLTEPELVAQWFTDSSPLGPVGSRYRLDFGDGSLVTGEVLAVEPGARFSHTWAWEGAEGAEVTVVTWTVEARPGGGTRIRLVHEGWQEQDGGGTARDEHESYWSGYLDDLRDVLEEA
jgi:uncharacterized protein YndB with AHSA1/START domain